MAVLVEGLHKSFGSSPVLQGLSETFKEGKISILLGPSGCGKTTTLRCIAGLERPSAGRICVNEQIVYQSDPHIWTPPEQRRLSMVFQSYAIWPHMTVFENVALPLRAAGRDFLQITKSVAETLSLVGLTSFAQRPATDLSGGQQQRVALARCIVSDSPVILMDEPFSNLDAKLRIAMRAEIRALQRRLGRTILFVTHDQEEALSIGDDVYLYREGHIVQKGAPKDIYENPATRYAAEFLGRANIIDNFEWQRTSEGSQAKLANGHSIDLIETVSPKSGSVLCIRPEKWRFTQVRAKGVIAGEVIETTFVGDRTEYRIDTAIGQISVTALNALERAVGEHVGLEVSPQDVKVVMN